MLLSREQLLSRDELKIERVDLGGDDFVFVRQMTGRERDMFERSITREVEDAKGNITYKQAIEDFRAKLVVNVICDENGVNILKPSDFAELSMNISMTKLEKIVAKAQELNKITAEDKEAMIKNSLPAQNEEELSESGQTPEVEEATQAPIDG